MPIFEERQILKLIISIGICQGAGIAGSFFTLPSIPGWYASLNKPAFTPPAWVFAPVWTVLFTLMGIAAFLVWRQGRSRAVRSALAVFVLQLALNVLWSAVFFGLRSIIGGLAVIISLLAAIVWTIKKFRVVSKPAADLLVPYLIWGSFALVLNFSLLLLNRVFVA